VTFLLATTHHDYDSNISHLSSMAEPPTARPSPVLFRIHAQATHKNKKVSALTISDEIYAASATASYCNLNNTSLICPVDISTVDHIDNVVITLFCIPVPSTSEEEKENENEKETKTKIEESFASININIGDYRDAPAPKKNKKNKYVTTSSSDMSTKMSTKMSKRGKLKFGQDEKTRELKRQATGVGEVSSNGRRKHIARWRTGYIAFKIKGSSLPEKLIKNKSGMRTFNLMNLATAVQPTTTAVAVAANTTKGTNTTKGESSIIDITLTLKTLMRTQSNASSDELANMNIESDLKRFAKDRKNLQLVLAIVIMFLVVGAIFYPLVEEWTVLDSLYFGVVTLTTIGYGDMGPTTDSAKIFTAIYVFFGVAIVATLIGMATTFLIEAAALRAEVEKREKREAGFKDSDSDDSEEEEEEEEEEEGEGDIEEGSAVVLPIEGDDSTSSLQTNKKTCWSRCFKRLPFFFYEFLPAFVCCSVGIIVMMYAQDVSFADAFYWSIVTGTTVGYGDVSPLVPVTRGFALVYLFFSVVTMGKALSAFGSLLEADDGHKESLLNRKLDEKFIISLDQDGTGEVSEFEYLSAMMVLLEYVQQDDIDNVMKAFRKLDIDGSGSLTVEDLSHSEFGHVSKIQKNLRRPHKVFKDCDTNSNGTLEATEVRTALKMLGSQMNDDDFNEMFQTMDKNDDGAVNYAEFKAVLYQQIVYSAIDNDVDGSLDREEIRESFKCILKMNVTDKEFQVFYDQMDCDSDGSVSFVEYKKFFQNPQKQKEKIILARKNAKAREVRGGSDYSVYVEEEKKVESSGDTDRSYM